MACFLNWTPIYSTYMRFGENQRAHITKTRVKKKWTTPSNTNNHSTFKDKHSWGRLV